MPNDIFARFRELEKGYSTPDLQGIELALLPKFVLSDYHTFVKSAQTTKDREDVISMLSEVANLAKSVISQVFSKSNATSADHSKIFLENFPLNETRYYVIWIECWKPFLRFISSNYLPSLEDSMVALVLQKAQDYTMTCDEEVSYGKIAWALMKILLKSLTSLKIESIGKLIEAGRRYRFGSAKDQESVEEILQKLSGCLEERKKSTTNIFSNFPDYPSAQELVYKFPSMVFYVLHLKREEQQELLSDLLIRMNYASYSRFLVAELLTRTASQLVLRQCHAVLDSNCLAKSVALIRNLPLSLCPGDLIQRVI
jgi:hypothetical protein